MCPCRDPGGACRTGTDLDLSEVRWGAVTGGVDSQEAVPIGGLGIGQGRVRVPVVEARRTMACISVPTFGTGQRAGRALPIMTHGSTVQSWGDANPGASHPVTVHYSPMRFTPPLALSSSSDDPEEAPSKASKGTSCPSCLCLCLCFYSPTFDRHSGMHHDVNPRYFVPCIKNPILQKTCAASCFSLNAL